MTSSKSTKRALLTSALAILACVAMLIGTTFAWFTDTASTSVNKIVSGKLDVALEMADGTNEDGTTKWVSAEDVTLNFLKAKEAKGEKILWEPGCTYELPKLRVVNKGTLALKYTIKITGIQGDAKLNDVIDWTINGQDINLTEQHLLAGEEGEAFTIKGHMWETAGNDYQELSIDGIGITVYATQYTHEYDSNNNQYDEDAEYPTITTGTTLNEVFGDANIDFGYGNTSSESVTLDGKGVTVVNDWADNYFNSDTTIKGVIFKNGASFTAKNSNITITLEDCTFYACDQDKAVAALGITDKMTGAGNGSRNNIVTNTGAGMCLNLEQQGGTSGVKLIVKNCTFVGENDQTLTVYGDKYDGVGKVIDAYKKRGHAIALNAISGGGTAGELESLLIDGCIINGVRGNAIQLYGKDGTITIKDTKINSWGINNGAYTNASGALKDADSYAVRGDYTGGRTLVLSNVYFGLDESKAVENHVIGHVKLSNILGYTGAEYSGNTDGSEVAGTYSK